MDKLLLSEAKTLIRQLIVRMENGDRLRMYSETATQAETLCKRMDNYIYGK